MSIATTPNSGNLHLENLHIGDEFRNYKEVCKFLNESAKVGKAKQLQIKNWKCYFDFEREGQKFIITEVFDEPFPNIDARKLRDGIYIGYIELLLMEYLIKQRDCTAYLTKQNLYELLGMTSCNYKKYRGKVDNINSSFDVVADEDDIKTFYSRADHKLNSILTSALKSMANRFLINYQTQYIINENNCEHIANDDEVKMILFAQRSVLKEMGYRNFPQVLANGQLETYFKNLDTYVFEKYEWSYFYSHIKIIYLQDDIQQQIPVKTEEIKKLSYKEKQLQLNNKVIEALDKQLETSNEFTEKDTDFKQIQQDLAEYLLRIK